MSACPVCRSAWPNVSATLQYAICASCFAAFQRHDGQWQQVPPGWQASAPSPFPVGTALRLRSIDYRVAGFASYSYQEESGRDQWETYERHEYTLTDVAGGNPRLLCWTSRSWFLARPVDPALVISKGWAEAEFEGRSYKMQQPQSFTSDRAFGYLTHPFRWRELVSISDFVSDRFVIAPDHPGREYRWAGEFLDDRELLTAVAMTEFPAAYRNAAPGSPTLVAASTPASPVAKSSSVLRLLGILLAVVAIFAAIGTAAYQYERRTKPMASQWFSCELKRGQVRLQIPAGSTKVELNPHLPQGALQYQIRIFNDGGTLLETHKDHLDMHPKRRSATYTLTNGAASIEATCNLTVRVADLDTWPVELRFFH